MPSLSFLRAAVLALVFVTSANAAGPTPTSVDRSESYYDGHDYLYDSRGYEGGNEWKNGWNHNNGGGGRPSGAKSLVYPTPSQQPRQRNVRRPAPLSPAELAYAICPSELTGCPIAQPGTLSAIPTSVSGWTEQGFECVDLKADLRACGGCPSLDNKYDCTSIEGADRIACVAGQCVVNSCREGYTLDSNKSTCQSK